MSPPGLSAGIRSRRRHPTLENRVFRDTRLADRRSSREIGSLEPDAPEKHQGNVRPARRTFPFLHNRASAALGKPAEWFRADASRKASTPSRNPEFLLKTRGDTGCE